MSVDFPIYYFSLNNYVSNDYVDEVVSFNLKPISNFNEDSEKINTFINKCIKEDKTVFICLKRFQIRSILKYLNMKIVETDFSNIKIGCVNIIESELNKGFIYNDLVVLTSFELFNDTSSRKKYVTKFKYSSSIKDINKLSVGDYVVHNTHGIGRYNGIKTLTMNDITKDYLEVLYQGTDKIYIPVEKIELISKYSGREGIAPKINKLGGADWSKTKNRVKTKVNDIADKLLKLYAERESKKGFAFSKDCDMSKDFENDFKFDLTADQSRAIVQIKEDMESIVPMDRLLSDDVILKDLGLLIIDEEQRFGVTHKEKIKEFKTNVDVLTLTATPIPRTLQMSLVGIRSLSLIETPPINRFPVQTYVVEENKQILKDAIYKELSREGQVFILYNRVQSIEEFASRIAGIVPDARIAVAHGQMNKTQLENTIIDFVNYEFDILICTTIIETGIDIPNVNTLIVIDADRFGLSQLYQLRGRVGRSNKFAYAYLMYQPFKSLTETAVKRLNVIKEFTELGSGFSIATRDLSIRGAGDILGSEQAGFIDSVGIDLYLRMLNDEINRRNENTENVEEVVEETANENKSFLNVTTHIDDSYVQEDDLKIEIHKIINSVDSREKFESVKLELEDRFGKISEDVIIYMYEEWFENLAKKLKVSNVHQNKNSIEIVFPGTVVSKFKVDEIFMDAYYVSNMFRFANKGSNLVIILDIIKLDKHPVYYLVELLDKIYSKFGKDID